MLKSLLDQYKVIQTKDGSPTLEFNDGKTKENMHNFHGALSETLYIYGEAFAQLLKSNNCEDIKTLSVGTGLGYNEFLGACYQLQTDKKIFIDSFEADLCLSKSFQSWLLGAAEGEDHAQKPTALTEVYNSILALYAAAFEIEDPVFIFSKLKQMSQLNQLSFYGAFDPQKASDSERRYNLLFYDLFSAKMNPEFWTEKSLVQFLNRYSAESSVFSTYAATGPLKRALKSAGFEVQVRKGFGGKRQSFLAAKGLA